MGRISKTVLHLVIINTLVLILMVLNEKRLFLPQTDLTYLLSLHYYGMPSFHWWQYLSYMFMRGDIFRLLFNIYTLWAFGTPLENIWGHNGFLFFYFSCGIGTALLQTGVSYYYIHQTVNALAEIGIPAEETIGLIREDKYSLEWGNITDYNTYKSMYDTLISYTMGASGAIYGILVAFTMFFPNARLMLFFMPYPIATRYFIPVIVTLDLFSGITSTPIFGSSIAYSTRMGDAFVGFLIMLFQRKRSFS